MEPVTKTEIEVVETEGFMLSVEKDLCSKHRPRRLPRGTC